MGSRPWALGSGLSLAGVLQQRGRAVDPMDELAVREGEEQCEHGAKMDDQQHALSGLLFAADAIEGRTNRSPDELLPVAAR